MEHQSNKISITHDNVCRHTSLTYEEYEHIWYFIRHITYLFDRPLTTPLSIIDGLFNEVNKIRTF